ncbi:ATPase-like protein [Colletotrichum phormii]|uniref:ATPase-like protein n=1 Tax=Colletotrichum phormii TaxID=359342 RepID=A0AAJ0A086_9PEZI|nr:ATPase-like protein [Colletotrichum phormii]KAK1640158.1 ATPase-like protein [Colletotrichum phormii]
MSSSCVNDRSLGPVVHGCRDDFDFTVGFEQAVLAIIPAAVLILCSLPRLFQLPQKQRIVDETVLLCLKLSALVAYSGLQLGHLILTCRGTYWSSQLGLASDALNFVASLIIILLSFLEHARSPRPSMLLGVYLLITVLFDIARTRTQWLSADSANDFRQARLSIASVILKVVVLIIESRKKKPASASEKQQSPEATSGIISLSTYFWVNDLFLRGFRKLLILDDLYALDEAMSAEVLYAKFGPLLENNKAQGHRHALFRGLTQTLVGPFILSIVPRLCQMGFKFCQPLMIESLLDYLQEPVGASSPNKGYGYIGAAFLIYVGMATSNSIYWYFQERFVHMARGILVSAVYRKTTVISLSAADDSAALTLMNADVERVTNGFQPIHEYWANTVEVALACWLLQRQIGAAFVAPVTVVIVCAAASMVTAKFTGKRQTLWMESIQQRVGVTAKAISSMKALKISAMSGPIESLIHNLRLKELSVGGKWRLMLLAAVTIAYTPSQLGPVMAFAVTSQTLNVRRIFTSMAYLMLLAGPLGSLFQTIPQLVSAFACLGRIQAYLDKDSRIDYRKRPVAPRSSSSESDTKPDELHASSIAVKQASFGWAEGKYVLDEVDVLVPANSLTIIVGPVASGKSTLLKGLLGEIPFHFGNVVFNVNHCRVGYCDQSPFLYNSTIEANIIGHSGLDPERYRQVIDATMLSTDFATLPKGDRTKIGSNGLTLSGGQRQRVALARALYLECDLLILDDILSGLDATTEEHVFSRVFGNAGIVRQRRITAVLCTHSVRHLPLADHIIALGVDCTVVEQGSFADLQTNGKYVQSLKIQEAETTPEGKTQTVTQVSDLAEEPDKARQLGDVAVYRHYFGSMARWVIAVFIFWCCAYAFCMNFPTVWLKFWSEDITAETPKRSGAFYMGIYALLQIMCLGSLMVVVFINTQTMISQSGSSLHQRALRTLVGAPLRFFATTDTGTVTNLFAQDLALIDSELPMALINFSVLLFAAVGMAVVIAVSSPWLAISYPFLAAILYFVQMFYLRTSRQLRILELELKSPLYSHFIDTLKGLATLRALGFISAGITVNNNLLDTSQRPAYQLAIIQRWLQLALQLLVAGLATIVVTLATQLRASSGFTGASLVTLMSFGDTLTTIVQSYTMLETSIGAVARLKTFSDTVTPETGPDEDMMPEESWPEKGAIEIKAVSASYGVSRDHLGCSGGEEKPPADLAIRDLHLSISPGERVAICGRTGSGKSSLILLLLRLMETLSGSAGGIVVDSVPLDKVDRDTLRRRIIAVSQDAIFLPDGSTVRDNLDPFDEATEAECLEVLEQVGLLAGIQERGGIGAELTAESFSQGQKQLFCLARAVLRRRVKRRGGTEGGILLLDEVSSSVDRATDLVMQEIIRREFEGYAIFMVSHRLDMVLDCDTVVVMDKGSVVEKGAPRVLKDRAGGVFRELWNSNRTMKE